MKVPSVVSPSLEKLQPPEAAEEQPTAEDSGEVVGGVEGGAEGAALPEAGQPAPARVRARRGVRQLHQAPEFKGERTPECILAVLGIPAEWFQ